MEVERHVRRLSCQFNPDPHASEKPPLLLGRSSLQLYSRSQLLVAVRWKSISCSWVRLLLLQYHLHWEVLAHTAQ